MDSIWEKVKQHQGEVFYTTTGLEFTYEIVEEKDDATDLDKTETDKAEAEADSK